MKKNHLFIITFLVIAATAVFLIPTKSAQGDGSDEVKNLIAGRNVNMVSGTTLPGGDPYLQRQNEPTIAVSSRNPLHLMAGANDYRTVDMPISGEELPGIEEMMAADAWLGYYTSYDGGESWKSYLLPGFPQDSGSSSPLKAYSTAADPWICAGSKGRFYYSGLAFNRGGSDSGIFVARFEDTNDKESGNTIEYRGVKIVATGNAGQFVDMPKIAVDIPRGAGNDFVYLVYTVFVGNLDQNIKSKMYCTRSTDGGLTWSSPTKLSESQHIIQGAALAIDPLNGDVYVTFRRFYHKSQDNGIVVVKSTDRGQTFSHPLEISTFPTDQFDQPATPNENLYPDLNDYVPGESFRTNTYPTVAVDDNHRVYVAWSQRSYGPGGEARIIMKTSQGGSSWSSPIQIDPPGSTHQGHQFMPQLAFGAGKLTLVWYDQRSDWSAIDYGFGQWISDWMQNTEGDLMRRTIDIWAAQVDADVYYDSSKWSYTQVSRYLYALLVDSSGNIQYYGDSPIIFPVQFNCPNYPMFKGGMLPFIGDYIAVVSSPTIILQNGQWVFNTQDSDNPVFHVAWTDNRDVRPPVGSWDWTDYTPANSTQSSEFISSGRTDCTIGGNSPAIRNQNIYTSKLSWGLVAGSPTNEKSLDLSVPRAFVIFVQNNTEVFRRLRLTITQEPSGGDASFLQFDSLDQIIVTIAPFSTISRQVFIQSTNPSDSARVDIVEIEANGNDIPGGLTGYVILNKDPSSDGVSGSEEYHQPGITNPNIVNWVVNPNIVNPNIVNPNIVNPNIVNPNIVNPNIVNDPLNPNIVNPNIVNPNIVNPNIVNPNIVNPNIVNPNIVNPNIVNPNIVNAGEPGNVDGVPVSDVMWTVKNEGNTATSYTLKTVAKKTPPDGVYAQLLVYRVHKTPAVAGEELSTAYGYDGCALYEEPHHELVLNIANPNIVNPNIVNIGAVNPNIVNPNIVNESILNATFSLGAGEEAIVDLRVLDTKTGGDTQDQTLAATQNKFSIQAFDIDDFISSIGFVVTSMSVDSDDAAAGIKIPKGTATDLYIASSNPPDGVVGDSYESYLTAFGGSAPYNYTWSLNSGELPPGLSIMTGSTSDPNVEGAYGIISGTPSTAGTYDFMVQVTDDPDYMDTQLYSITIHEGSIPDTPTITTASLPGGVKDTWYGATIHVSGGNPPYTFTWSNGSTSPPEADGLYLDLGNGIISGTPTEAATYNFKVKVTDYDGEYDEQTYDLVILASPANYWKISGTVYDENTGDPLEGVLLHGLPNTPTTDTYGYYEDDVPEGWEGTVTPFKLDHTFDPEQRTYTSADTVADLPGQDYNLEGVSVPAKLVFIQQPGGGVADKPWTQQPIIEVQDAGGNKVTTDNSTQITLAVDRSNPIHAMGYLAGKTTLIVTAGLASFSGLEIFYPELGYTLEATAPGLTSAKSDPFDITSPPPIIESEWEKRFNGGADDGAIDMRTDSFGNVFVTGSSQGVGTDYDFYTIKYDNAGNVDWEARFNNNVVNGSDYASAIAVDPMGNTYVTGSSQGNGTDYDYLTIKYDSSGNEVWSSPIRFNGSGNGKDTVSAMAVDSSGNVYVTGESLSSSGHREYATIKYDTEGGTLWTALFQSPDGADRARDIAVDSIGNVYVTGSIYVTGSATDYATIKYDSNGNQLWVKSFNGTGNDYDDGRAIAIDNSGNVYVTGSSDGSGGFDWATIKYNSDGDIVWPGDGAVYFNSSGTNADFGEHIAVDSSGNIYVTGTFDEPYGTFATVKYDANGTELWAQPYIDATASVSMCRDLIIDASGNVFVAAQSYGNSADYVTVKYDTNGKEFWKRKFNGPSSGYENSSSISLDSSGNVFITGFSEGDFATIKYTPSLEEWVARYDGAGDSDHAYSLVLDPDGNVYVTGYSVGGSTDYDYATIKYDNSGNELWEARYDGTISGLDIAKSIAVDSSGNVYVTGHSEGSSNVYDYTTIKYNSSGNKLWEARYDSPGSGLEEAESIAVDSSGNVYVTGYTIGDGTGEDYTTIKYDSSGNELWVARYDGPGNYEDEAKSLVVDNSGNVYVTGYSWGSGTNRDYATIKYDSSGNELWVARYDGTGGFEDEAYSLAADSDGNVYVTGWSLVSDADSTYDYTTIKYDSSGNELWVAQYDGPGGAPNADFSRYLAVDSDGNVYVTGSNDAEDCATIKYDSNGNELWVSLYDGPGSGLGSDSDAGYSLALDSSGNVYVAGYSYGSGTSHDYVIIKYDSSGNELWVARYDGPANASDMIYSLSVDSSGNVYVTGRSRGSGTGSDYATIKYKNH